MSIAIIDVGDSEKYVHVSTLLWSEHVDKGPTALSWLGVHTILNLNSQARIDV
jgi:hypothetical protein